MTTTPYPLVVIAGVAGALLVATLLVGALVLSGHSADLTNPSVVIVLGFCSTAILTLLGIGGVHGQVAVVHQLVNSRLDQLVAASSAAAHAAGVVEGAASVPTTPTGGAS